MAQSTGPRPFTRLPIGSFPPESRSVISDIYDKLAATLAALSNLSTAPSKAPSTPTGPVVTPQGPAAPPSPVAPVSIEGADGRAASPQYAFLPDLPVLPSTNPVAGLPYSQDGLALLVAPSSTAPDGLLYRYDLVSTLWVYQSGILRTDITLYPLPTSPGDIGLLLRDTTTGTLYRWTGVYWQPQTSLGAALSTTHAGRVGTGTLTVRFGSSTVTTSGTGTTVTRTAGDFFDNTSGYWPGKQVLIAAAPYTIASVTSNTVLELTTPAPLAAGSAFTTVFPFMAYTSGTFFQHAWAGYFLDIVVTVPTLFYVTAIGFSHMYVSNMPAPGTYTWYMFQNDAVNYPNGTLLYETDRGATYIVKDATGTVDTLAFAGQVTTNGTTVTWVSGNSFDYDPSWAGLSIVINAVTYVIASVTSSTILQLTTSAGIQAAVAYTLPSVVKVTFDTGVPFSINWYIWRNNAVLLKKTITVDGVLCAISAIVSSTVLHAVAVGVNGAGLGVTYSVNAGAWWYDCGIMLEPDATLAPTDLVYTDVGFLYRSALHQRVWSWDGVAGVWHYADAGLGAGSIVGSPSAAIPPSGGLWHRCDGTNASCILDDLSSASIPTPNLSLVGSDKPFVMGGNGGVYTTSPATVETWAGGAQTDPESAHVHVVLDLAHTTLSAGANNVVTSQVTSAGSAHYHLLSNANAILNTPNETDGGLPLRISLAWWMRC